MKFISFPMACDECGAAINKIEDENFKDKLYRSFKGCGSFGSLKDNFF